MTNEFTGKIGLDRVSVESTGSVISVARSNYRDSLAQHTSLDFTSIHREHGAPPSKDRADVAAARDATEHKILFDLLVDVVEQVMWQWRAG